MDINIGDTFGRWRVQQFLQEDRYKKAKVQCLCGKENIVRVSTLLSGESKSCGCLAAELASERVKTHGFSKHPLYQAWYDMYRRCNIESRKDYHHYGGRGIKVCDRWMPPAEEGFKNFLEDMLPLYSEGLEIDRKDVNGDYNPLNCRWVTRSVNCSNKRSYFVDCQIEYNGDSICLSELSRRVGIPNRVLWDRLFKLNWSYEKAITTPMKAKRMFLVINGDMIPFNKFCKEHSINYSSFCNSRKSLGLGGACERFLKPFNPEKLIGTVNSELIDLYDFNLKGEEETNYDN